MNTLKNKSSQHLIPLSLALALTLALTLTLAQTSLAQNNQKKTCTFNGKEYKEGTRVGYFVCKKGKWKRG